MLSRVRLGYVLGKGVFFFVNIVFSPVTVYFNLKPFRWTQPSERKLSLNCDKARVGAGTASPQYGPFIAIARSWSPSQFASHSLVPTSNVTLSYEHLAPENSAFINALAPREKKTENTKKKNN